MTYVKLTIKTPERHYWHRSGVFIVNFEYFITFSTVSIVDFEQVITCWEWQFKFLYLYADQCLTEHSYMSLQTHIIHLGNLKNVTGKYFPKLVIGHKILQNTIWIWQKLIVFLNTRFQCKYYAIHKINIKVQVKNIPSLF